MNIIKIYKCEFCLYQTNNKAHYKTHLYTNSHKRIVETNDKQEINKNKENTIFECEICKYKAKTKSNINRHYLSNKHMKLTNTKFDDIIINAVKKKYFNIYNK
jgi:uncharacterized Zn-finger protein